MAMIAGREYCMRSFPMGFVPNSNVALLFILFSFWGRGGRVLAVPALPYSTMKMLSLSSSAFSFSVFGLGGFFRLPFSSNIPYVVRSTMNSVRRLS